MASPVTRFTFFTEPEAMSWRCMMKKLAVEITNDYTWCEQKGK